MRNNVASFRRTASSYSVHRPNKSGASQRPAYIWLDKPIKIPANIKSFHDFVSNARIKKYKAGKNEKLTAIKSARLAKVIGIYPKVNAVLAINAVVLEKRFRRNK